jgi:hypothetical protein
MSWATLSASANRVAFARLGSNTVTAGAVTGSGFLAINSELVVNNDVVMIDYLLTILTSQFGNLSFGDLITIDGSVYKVEHEPMRIDDGTFSRIPLMKTLQQIITAVFTTDVFESGVFVA